MSGYGQLQVHQRLSVCAVEMKYALGKVEEAERGHDSDNTQNGRDPQHQAHIPFLGPIAVMHLVISDRENGAVVEYGNHHDHHRGHGVEIKYEDRQRHEEQHAESFGDAIDCVTVHPLEDAAALLDRIDDHRETGCEEYDVRRRAGRVGCAGNRDAAVRLLERGSVVHPVAGHTDNMAVLLQDVDNVVFVFGEHLGETVRFFDGRRRLRLLLFIPQYTGIQDVRAHAQLTRHFLGYG